MIGHEILQEGRGKVDTIVMEHFKNILFQKSGSANKQYTYQSVNYNLTHSTAKKSLIFM